MAADQDAQGRLTGVARRHLKLVCSLAAVATVAGVAGGFLLPASAKATATVLISPLDGNPYSTNGRGDDLTNLQSEAALVQADTVQQVVRQKFRAGDRSKVTVTVPPNTAARVVSEPLGGWAGVMTDPALTGVAAMSLFCSSMTPSWLLYAVIRCWR